MENIIYYNPKTKPFEIYGLYCPLTEPDFKRVPDELAKSIGGNVECHYRSTAGGRVRFKTNSDFIYIRYDTIGDYVPHLTGLTSGGVDFYIDYPFKSVYAGCIKHNAMREGGTVEGTIQLPSGEKEITINLPLYGRANNLEIGLAEGSTVEKHTPYRHEKPVLFYGSSITQGACASRPGTCYEARISRQLDCDYINLGFSGGAHAEDSICEHMAQRDFSAFVSDYDHNATDVEFLRNTHYKLYDIIRREHPDVPYIMVTKPDFSYLNPSDVARRAVIMESYLRAYNNGDRNVYFVDGAAFMAGESREEATIDKVHPTDCGFERMANNIGDVLKYALRW